MITELTIISVTIFLFVTVLFILSLVLKRNDIADVAWGVGILLVAGISYGLSGEDSKISTIIFTPCCNFRCDYCHTSEFILPEKLKNVLKNLIMEKTFFNFLEKRK